MMIVTATRLRLAAALWVLALAASAHAQTATPRIIEPTRGQPGKDVVWVPTPLELVEQMLDLAQVTPYDFVIDLGSGDGRNVIAAAKRGANALGIEFDQNLVLYSQREAEKAGVANKAKFERADMFKADISKATVLALFLLPSNLFQMSDKFLNLRPGTRIVVNTFTIGDWEPDVTIGTPCDSWCMANLWIVPAKVAGTWRLDNDEIMLTQKFQMISGSRIGGAGEQQISGRLRGDQISFKIGDAQYSGRVDGNTMSGRVWSDGRETDWTARRQ